MSVPQLLAKLAGRCSWKSEQSGYSYGSLSASDIAYCLSGLSPEHTAFCRVKYLGDTEPMPDLIGWVIHQSQDNRHSLSLAMLAVLESISPRKCVSCSGRGEIHHKAGRITDCQRCKGSGNLPFTDTERAKLIGISRQAFKRKWEDRYQDVYRRLVYLDYEVLRHVKSKI